MRMSALTEGAASRNKLAQSPNFQLKNELVKATNTLSVALVIKIHLLKK